MKFTLAALLSALLHAGWNAAVKAAARPAETMTAQMLLGAAMVVPALFWSGLPAMASWPWVLASTLTNTLTVTALLRAYALGGFGVVYPVVRASGSAMAYGFTVSICNAAGMSWRLRKTGSPLLIVRRNWRIGGRRQSPQWRPTC